jgi:uncharacterized membrane protein
MPNDDPAFPGFRLRGSEVTRLESFSDAVFGFALTLLVVSLDVPRSFADLFAAMRGFPSFAICFLFLALIWNGHYKFCRRFGLHDGWTRFLTCLLLFVVLFYVYPLKFLFNLSITRMLLHGGDQSMRTTAADFSGLLTIYGLGFAAVYLALLFLYLHAYRLREALELSELEKFDTRYQMCRLLALIGIGLLAALLAWQRVLLAWGGLIYLLLIPILRIGRLLHRRRRKQYLTSAGR